MSFLPWLLGAGVLRNATGCPAEIRNIKSQMSKSDQAQFIDDYKHLSKDKKTAFKSYLRDADLKAAGDLIGMDLTKYRAQAVKPSTTDSAFADTETEDSAMQAQLAANAAFNKRIQDILAVPIPGLDPQLVAEAAKQYQNTSLLKAATAATADKAVDISQ